MALSAIFSILKYIHITRMPAENKRWDAKVQITRRVNAVEMLDLIVFSKSLHGKLHLQEKLGWSKCYFLYVSWSVAEYSADEFAALKLMFQKFVTLRWPFKVVYRNSYIICAPGHFLPDLPLLILPSSHRQVSHLHLSLHQQPINMLLLRVHRLHMHLRTDLFLIHSRVQHGHRYLARLIRVHPWFTQLNQYHLKILSFLRRMETCRQPDRTLIFIPILSPLPFFPLSRASKLWVLLCLSVTSFPTQTRRECLENIHTQDRRDMAHHLMWQVRIHRILMMKKMVNCLRRVFWPRWKFFEV